MWWEHENEHKLLFASVSRQRDSRKHMLELLVHRLNFPLRLKSSFRVKADSRCRCGSTCVTFSSGWTFSRTNQTAVCQLFHSTGLVLSPTDSGYSQICPCSHSSMFYIPTESKTQNSKAQLTIWSASSWALCLLDTIEVLYYWCPDSSEKVTDTTKSTCHTN